MTTTRINEISKTLAYFETNNGIYSAIVEENRLFGIDYLVHFKAFGCMDNDYRGTNGLGMKSYPTLEKAIAAAKRYIKARN